MGICIEEELLIDFDIEGFFLRVFGNLHFQISGIGRRAMRMGKGLLMKFILYDSVFRSTRLAEFMYITFRLFIYSCYLLSRSSKLERSPV